METTHPPIGYGSYATVREYMPPPSETEFPSIPLAIKLAVRPDCSASLDREWTVGSYLPRTENLLHFISHGENSGKCSFIILPKLGKDLSCLVKFIGGSFSLATTLIAALELLEGLTAFHATGLVHCDIKPVCELFVNRTTTFT